MKLVDFGGLGEYCVQVTSGIVTSEKLYPYGQDKSGYYRVARAVIRRLPGSFTGGQGGRVWDDFALGDDGTVHPRLLEVATEKLEGPVMRSVSETYYRVSRQGEQSMDIGVMVYRPLG